MFFADVGLIKSIKPAELEKLRRKAGTTLPSLPSNSGTDGNSQQGQSSILQSQSRSHIARYITYLTSVGYRPSPLDTRIPITVSYSSGAEAYYDGRAITIDARLVNGPDIVISEYTWFVLKQTNPETFQTFWSSTNEDLLSIGYGLKQYLPCSHLNSPLYGKGFYSLSETEPPKHDGDYVYDLGRLKRYQKGVPASREVHNYGSIWSSAFWEIRNQYTREKIDAWLLGAWREFRPEPRAKEPTDAFIRVLLSTSEKHGIARASIRQALTKRGLE